MSEYPEDVIRVAKEALGEQWCAELGGTRGWLLRRDRIAEAIMAERERCAKIAETMKAYEIGDRFMLTAAIRKGDVAK